MRKDDTNNVLNKVKSAIPSLFNSQEVSDKAIMFAENFPKISNLDDSGISLPVFFSRTNLKRHNISLTLKLVQKVTTSLALLKVFGPDFIPVVILKNCKPELLYMLAELFNMCLMEFFFVIVGRSHLWFLCLRILERSTATNYHLLVFFLWFVKSIEKPINNRPLDHLGICGFQYGFRST